MNYQIKMTMTYRNTIKSKNSINPIINKDNFLNQIKEKNPNKIIYEIDFKSFEPFVLFNILNFYYKDNKINQILIQDDDLYTKIQLLMNYDSRKVAKISFIKFIYGSKNVIKYDLLNKYFGNELNKFINEIILKNKLKFDKNYDIIYNYFNLPIVFKRENVRKFVLLNYYIQSTSAILIKIFMKNLLNNSYNVLYNIYDNIILIEDKKISLSILSNNFEFLNKKFPFTVKKR